MVPTVRFSPPYVLAFDVGTTGCKTVLVDSEGRLAHEMTRDYPSITSASGVFEQDPAEWLRSIRATTRMVTKRVKKEDLAGAGFCGTMAGALPLDKAGRPLRNAIMYADTRGADQTDKIAKRFSARDVYATTGNPLSPVYSLTKWMWIKENEPQKFAKTFKLVQSKDFLVCQFTGEIVTDYVDASATMAFNVTKKTWDWELLEAGGIPADKLPEPKCSLDVAGEVSGEAAETYGLRKGLPVIVGCGDTAALLGGTGAVQNGSATVYLGAAAEIDLATDRPLFSSNAFIPVRCHAVPDMWFNSASAVTSGTALRWFKNQFCSRTETYQRMDAEASKVPVGSGGLTFLPHLSGERMPMWDPKARGAFIGISTASSKAHFYRAVLEGVAFSLRSISDAYGDMGVAFKNASISGGGAESRLWRQIVVDVLGIPCVTLARPEVTSAIGVALYINGALNGRKRMSEMMQKAVEIRERVLPDKENVRKYERFYRIYRRCYPALAEIMHSLVEETRSTGPA